jgi:hypothetical protein
MAVNSSFSYGQRDGKSGNTVSDWIRAFVADAGQQSPRSSVNLTPLKFWFVKDDAIGMPKPVWGEFTLCV